MVAVASQHSVLDGFFVVLKSNDVLFLYGVLAFVLIGCTLC